MKLNFQILVNKRSIFEVKFQFLCLSRKGCSVISLLVELSTKMVICLKFCVSWYFFKFLFYVLFLFLIHLFI